MKKLKKIIAVVVVGMLVCTSAFAAVERTLLDEVVTTGASAAFNSGGLLTKTIVLTVADAAVGGTVIIQTATDKTGTWIDLNTQTITGNGVTEIAIVGLIHRYIRVNVTVRNDGTYSATIYGK